MSSPALHFFGIRHHGPGCARSLLHALEQLQPDSVLIEGPPEGEAVLPLLAHEDMQPPVALLVYAPDAPQQAAFYPFAAFSPEWQALQWATKHNVPVRFIDLPQTHVMALEVARQAEENAAQQEHAETEEIEEEKAEESGQTQENSEPPENEKVIPYTGDPLDALAQAAGDSDGERWWNRLVEERNDTSSLFDGIHEAMAAVREAFPYKTDPIDAQREVLREAWMRQSLRSALKSGAQRIAVICGAWHVCALQQHTNIAVKADAALLKGLPKLKVQATWAPWTYRNLSSASGYRAGVDSPGWYEHLWLHAGASNRSIHWLAKVADLLRENGLDCSSAHIIEAVRLAESLAVLRGHAHPGLAELDEAIITTVCMGDTTPLRLIKQKLIIGERLGHVPADVPQVPLQRDIAAQQKTLRLKAEAVERLLALDLRKETDLARSHFFHRLRLLEIDWATLSTNQQRNLGTFRESWQLQWQPELAVRIIQASRWGNTLIQAASAKVLHGLDASTSTSLPELADLLDAALLANLPHLVDALIERLEQQAATTADLQQLLQTLPPLARVLRYGSVRQSDNHALGKMIDSLALRAAIALPLASSSLNEEAAQKLNPAILNAHEALHLRENPEISDTWLHALHTLAHTDSAAALLRGTACHLLLDAARLNDEDLQRQLSYNLSLALPPLDTANWLTGLLNRQAVVLLHTDAIWNAVDQWLSELPSDIFTQILPLLRRSFAEFSRSERRELGEKAAQGQRVSASLTALPATATHDAHTQARAMQVLPILEELLGVKLTQ